MQLWYAFNWTSSKRHFVIQETHRKYGDVVRIGPNELSFSSVESYKDIYGYSTKGKKPFLKSTWYANDDSGPPVVLGTRDPVDHRGQRQSLSHAFSAKSLRDQEVVVHKYVDLFIEQIGQLGGPGTAGINIPEAFNWLTFDIIGDLAFGESFAVVATGKINFWVSIIFDGTWFGLLVGLRRRVPLMNMILPFIVPKDAGKNHMLHQKLTAEEVAKRIEQKDTLARSDLFHHILKKGDFTQEGPESQASTLIVAGSETTATFLSGATYFPLKNPDCVSKLQQEVRDAFVSIAEITGDSTNALTCLRGVIEEALRLCPPAPFGLSRVSPGGVVAGHYVPAGTMVSTDHWTTMHDPRYWHEPDSFHPERWIGDGFGDTKEASQPFSLGPRACIGINLAYIEARVILSKMAWQYDWELVTQDADWYRDSRLCVLWKKPTTFVCFHSRET
ncbi:hypothetical protein NW754_011441 [Fusarium falciforme]|nr:hypothetical protein NW754_011441 [Fusarium falciforme]KAJ4188156.1 hypothetical protein NW767_012005 [Fusarium falciforme]